MAYNLALFLPFLLFWATVKVYWWWRAKSSPTPPVLDDLDGEPQVSDVEALLQPVPDTGAEPDPAAGAAAAPGGIRGAWIRVRRIAEDEDDTPRAP